MTDIDSVVAQVNECAERGDFDGVFAALKANRTEIWKKMSPAAACDALKKATKDRLIASFVDGAEFGRRPGDDSLVRLEKLLSFNAGALVLSKAWGLGKVIKADYFYRRITVDFPVRKGHQFTYPAAADMLEAAPLDHILVRRESDPTAVEAMLKDNPGDFIKEVLKSYGDMTLVKLEDVVVANGFVKSVNWKGFWSRAREALKRDKTVVVPVKRTEPLQLKPVVENFGAAWLAAFSKETDPKLILAGVRDYLAFLQRKKSEEHSAGATDASMGDEVLKDIGERLAFAVTAARKVDDALYARLACQVTELGFANPPAQEMRDYLWERNRFIKAAAQLPAREIGAMIAFLSVDDAARQKLCNAIPKLCFAAVMEVVSRFKDITREIPAADGGSAKTVWPYREAIGAYMKDTQAPATLTALIVGKIEQFGKFEYANVKIEGKQETIRTLKNYSLWPELPPVVTLLAHAIALGEGRRSGEVLKMQNIIRRLFGDKAWLEKVFRLLSPADRVIFFERFQASIAWDPSTHHTIVVRMTRIAPELEAHVVKAEKKREYARITSYRSYAMKKAEYLKLINEDMPANVKRIEFAKSYGDLSENAEYQYAKDEQRALMQKQTLMQQELEQVKAGDFADATTDEVMPGVSVVISAPDTNGDGTVEKTYHVLGEWDNDVAMGVLSCKTKLAENMLGKKVGDEFELPGTGTVSAFARIVQINPLGDDIREWMKLPAGMQI